MRLYSSLRILFLPHSAFPAREPGDPVPSGQGGCTGRSAQDRRW